MIGIIGTIVFGAIIGALARLVIPGRQPMGILITILIGVVGALAGYWIWGAIADDGNVNTSGIDWIRWVISIAVAVVLVLAYSGFTRRRG